MKGRGGFALAVGALLLPGCVFAVNTGGDGLEKRVDRLEKRVKALEEGQPLPIVFESTAGAYHRSVDRYRVAAGDRDGEVREVFIEVEEKTPEE